MAFIHIPSVSLYYYEIDFVVHSCYALYSNLEHKKPLNAIRLSMNGLYFTLLAFYQHQFHEMLTLLTFV